MKEEIRNIIETAHTDMGYKFLCITETDVPETITRLHRLFLQKQIEMLNEVLGMGYDVELYAADKENFIEPIDVQNLITSLQNQLDNE